MLSSYEEDWQLEDSDMLCWEDRLLHMNSKVRYAGNVDLIFLCDSITDPKDHRIRELGPLFKETVNDSDVIVQDKALDALIAYLKAADADVAGGYAKEICDAIVANCLTDRWETVTKAQIVFMLWIELEAVDEVLDAMEKAIKTHVAKAVLPAIDVMVQAIREFGSKIVPPKRLLKMLLEIYDHKDKGIRDSSKRLILELCRWIGRGAVKSILFEKMSDTMKKELDALLANVRVAAKPTRKIRCEQAKEPEQKIATDAARSGTSEEYATRFDRGVDILTPLEKSGFWYKVKSRKWTQRKEAVAELTKLASTKRIAPGDYTELGRTLKKLIIDGSICVRVEAIRAIRNLALGLGVDFSRCSHVLLPDLLRKFGGEKPFMTEELTNTLQAIHKAGCVTLAKILKAVKAAVKSEDPHVCSRTLNWVMYCIASSNKAVILKVHKDYVQICLECLNDRTAQVRDAAFSVLVAIAKSVGMELLNMSLEKLDDVRRKKLSAMISVSGGTVARHGSMKRGLRRGRIAEPSGLTLKGNESRIESYFQEHSITQLKNAEPLEVTNQLQKMSLSDSQERNKKKKQHYGSENVISDEEEVMEELMEELAEELEWIKSHKCTMCRQFYDISCVCQQELELDMDEIRPGLFNYGLDRQYLKRAKSAVSDGGGKNHNDDSWSFRWEDPFA